MPTILMSPRQRVVEQLGRRKEEGEPALVQTLLFWPLRRKRSALGGVGPALKALAPPLGLLWAGQPLGAPKRPPALAEWTHQPPSGHGGTSTGCEVLWVLTVGGPVHFLIDLWFCILARDCLPWLAFGVGLLISKTLSYPFHSFTSFA